MVTLIVSDSEADQNDAAQMIWRTGLVYQFQSASRWLETEQHGDPLCRHHWSSIFKIEEEPTTTTTVLLWLLLDLMNISKWQSYTNKCY